MIKESPKKAQDHHYRQPDGYVYQVEAIAVFGSLFISLQYYRDNKWRNIFILPLRGYTYFTLLLIRKKASGFRRLLQFLFCLCGAILINLIIALCS